MTELQRTIEAAWEDRSKLEEPSTSDAINTMIEYLDHGRLRVAEPVEGGWKVNDWIKKGVILYFPLRKMLHSNSLNLTSKPVAVSCAMEMSEVLSPGT